MDVSEKMQDLLPPAVWQLLEKAEKERGESFAVRMRDILVLHPNPEQVMHDLLESLRYEAEPDPDLQVIRETCGYQMQV